jgi:hypothetical protein
VNNDASDCLGQGTYYNLGSDQPDANSDRVNNRAAASKQELIPSEVRIDPTTGEEYRLCAMVSDLAHPDWYIRIRAAWSLGRTGDIEALLPLVSALNDEHKQVRDRAQEALHALESGDEPLPVRVLLCETITDKTRTDMLLAVTGARSARSMFHGYGSVKAYCEHWLEENTAELTIEEQAVMAGLKQSAAAVLAELSNRSDAGVLLRAGNAYNGAQPNQLLRSSDPGNRPGEVEHLLLPSCEGNGGTKGTRETEGT